MTDILIPKDLWEFLDAGGQLTYDPRTCEAGQVILCPLSELKLRTFGAQCYGTPHEKEDPHRGWAGVYRVPGIDLIASCTGDYEPNGLLIWFPGESSYGVWDESHDYILVFGPEVTWKEISYHPARYINTQWMFEDLDRAKAQFIKPWPKYPFDGFPR